MKNLTAINKGLQVGFIIFGLLYLWSANANSDFYYQLDKLVGGEGVGGDGDTFYMITLILLGLDILLLIVINMYFRFKAHR